MTLRADCIDLTGARVGEITVLGPGPVWRSIESGRALGRWWRVRCDCGHEWLSRGQPLRRGETRRCYRCRCRRTGALARARSLRLPSGRLLVEVAEAAGVSLNTTLIRWRRGWTEEDLLLPVSGKRGRRQEAA